MYNKLFGNYNVDIVMCIDGTASMRPVMAEVKAKALSFHKKLFEALEEYYEIVGQLRIKVIVFRDYVCGERPIEESEFFVLDGQTAEFNAFVNAIEAKGESQCKNALEAIAVALKSDWTTGGSRRRHIILVFSDSAALPLGECASCAGYPRGMPENLNALTAWWEGFNNSLDSNYQNLFGRMVAFVPNAYPWTDMQAWNRYWPVFSRAGDGVSDDEIRDICDCLIGDI